MKQFEPRAIDKWRPPFKSTWRGLIDGSIDNLLPTLNRHNEENK